MLNGIEGRRVSAAALPTSAGWHELDDSRGCLVDRANVQRAIATTLIGS